MPASSMSTPPSLSPPAKQVCKLSGLVISNAFLVGAVGEANAHLIQAERALYRGNNVLKGLYGKIMCKPMRGTTILDIQGKKHSCFRRGLNTGPCAYETHALPLSYESCRFIVIGGYFLRLINIRARNWVLME